MDPNLVALFPQAGIYGVLVAVIVYLLRSNAGDRKQYTDALAAMKSQHALDITNLEKRYTEEMKRLEDRHHEDMNRVSQKLVDLEASNARVLNEYEEERKKRWVAENEAAKERRLRETLERQLGLDRGPAGETT
jgi:hypothetical protein